jgi:dipeptidyl aminopeptidase/acylaminoacyl peptidase
MKCELVRTGSMAILMLLAACAEGAGQVPSTLREPLPLELVTSLHGHNGRSPINMSSDGAWVAHTVRTPDRVPRDSISRRWSASGFPFAEGDARMQATLSNASTGEVVQPGGERGASWAPVWAPDGRRVAFYSDEDGTAGLWLHDPTTRRSTRLTELIVRPFFGFETPRWLPAGERIIVKVLPQYVSVAEANAREAGTTAVAVRFPAVAPDEPSVFVRRHDPLAERGTPAVPAVDPAAPRRVIGDVAWSEVDLVMIGVHDGEVTRLEEAAAVRMYEPSPDGRYVAYTVLKGWEENTQQSSYDLVAYDMATGQRRTLGANLRMGYGIEWSWSPDSRNIAMISSGQLGSGEIVLFTVTDGRMRSLARESVPSFNRSDGEYPPLWDNDGAHIYAVSDGALWRVDAGSGRGERVAHVPGWTIVTAVWSHGHSSLWSSEGRTAWVMARERDGTRSGIFAVDLVTGTSRAVQQEEKVYSGIFSLTASDATGEIAFVASGQHQLAEVWLLDTSTAALRQASRINRELDRYELGTARVIAYQTDEGRPLHGALLLPPGYQPGTRVPLVVWVYGGAMGSRSVNSFSLTGMGAVFNMQVLATRGYAVLFPDMPLREGKVMADLLRTVMPAVDAAIEQGFADPERLAIMGQSYGSYSTLALITQTTRFRAAVITAAVLHPDLLADYFRSIGYYEHGQGNMGGSIWEHPQRYLANSPLLLFDRIETPLLIGQGEHDGNLVPADAIFAALQRLGKPVEYRLYGGEGHVISRAANVLDFWRRRLDFLAEHLDIGSSSRRSPQR